ncbi:hypothetical protein [Catenulispora rubra]|uniref:hypothetical protein n=1 Tax=Catenulispora rubra TaxID=280293 RepID=UPI0018923F4B|nr:hypothetical protein [Catenulispora rubra]
MPDNLNGVMRSATENLNPNIGKLTAGGIERGVRKRRNRRVAQIAGAAASVTAVFGVVAAVGAPGHGSPATVSAGSGATPTAPKSSAVGGLTGPAATPTPTTTSTTKTPAVPPVSGDDMAGWLEQVLAPYHFTGEKVLYSEGSDGPAGPYATLRIGYDGQAGSVSLNVIRSSYQDQSGGSLPPYFTERTLPDGSHLQVFDGPEWPAGNGDPSAKRIDVEWYRTDGIAIEIQVLNAVQEKGTTTAGKLGLTTDQATAVVQSAVWDKAIAAVWAKPRPSAPKVPSSEMSKLLQQKNAGGSTPVSSPASSPVSSPAS